MGMTQRIKNMDEDEDYLEQDVWFPCSQEITAAMHLWQRSTHRPHHSTCQCSKERHTAPKPASSI